MCLEFEVLIDRLVIRIANIRRSVPIIIDCLFLL